MTTNERSSLLQQRLEWSGLGTILRNHQLEVPPFQRAFAWDRGDIDDFWNDLTRSLAADEPEYFLGPIVIAGARSEDNRLTVIDGQQRLATASILFSVIRDRLESQGDSDTANAIREQYLGNQDLRSRAVTPRILLSRDDRPFFRETISLKAENPPLATRKSHELLVDAREYFSERINEVGPSDPVEMRNYLLDLVDFINERAIVMLAVVPHESDAYTIFETLNARGTPLAIADLLKNHLFSEARGSIEEVMDFWTSAIGLVAEVNEDAVTDFLRHYWISRNGVVRERDLYVAFRTQITSEATAQQFAADLEEAARRYVVLLNANHERWSELGPSVSKAAEVLATFRLEQNRPMLLAAFEHLNDNELKKLIPSLVSWTMRGLIVGGIGKGRTEEGYARAALAIQSGEVGSAAGIFEQLSSMIPTDSVFRSAFVTYMPPTNGRSHYILRALETAARNESEPYLVPNPDHRELTLEHVLPKRPAEGDWDEFDDDQRREYVKRLGNHLLVPRRLNTRLGNKPFDDKKDAYAEAPLLLTNEVAEESEWTMESIENRQSRLADQAVSVWPRGVN